MTTVTDLAGHRSRRLRAVFALTLIITVVTLAVIGARAAILIQDPLSSPDRNGLPIQGIVQGIYGNVTFSPTNPGPCITYLNGTYPPPEDVKSNVTLVIRPQNGSNISVSLNWKLYHLGCDALVASFHVALRPGTYVLTLSHYRSVYCCNGGGNLPLTVIVYDGRFTPVWIYVDTGIR